LNLSWGISKNQIENKNIQIELGIGKKKKKKKKRCGVNGDNPEIWKMIRNGNGCKTRIGRRPDNSGLARIDS
jgi:hypothetical protein